MTANLLARETSPYLLQHRDNPVHWRPWGPDAFAEARRENKPILLSIGYAACHWCHVMAHESFEDDATARLMNALFVNIKVDREERPDVDTLYQTALALLGEQGGWPLTLFLTPDGVPFWGGTYFPATPRYGRPPFADVLRAVADAYREKPDAVAANAAALKGALARLSRPAPGAGLTMADFDRAAGYALRLIDLENGGTRGAPKFPQPVLFRFLWRAYRRSGDAALREAVTKTLDSLAEGGIYDHVAGGFARYATDAEWLVPHFEKMLYDNALLVELMSEVWRETRSPLYARRVRETIGWALRELRLEHGASFALAAAFDADSEGVEGKHAVWTETEIDALLGADAALFKAAYDVTSAGNWEGKNILNRRRGAVVGEAQEEILAACLATLRAARSRRVPPLRDDKVLADWNGLMITALTHAALAFDQPGWLRAAEEIFAFVCEHMQRGGRLFHSWCAGVARHPAVLDDYANLARAALALHEATGERAFLDRAQGWVETADRHYWDAADGGYYLSADDTADILARTKTAADNATPSGNGTMAEVLVRLFLITGEDAFRERAETVLRLFSGAGPEYLLTIPGLLCARQLLDEARQVVIIGDREDARTAALVRAAFTAPEPLSVVTPVAPGTALPAAHPAAGKTPIDGAPTAYVCTGQTCGLPLTSAADLSKHLVGG